ncbi:hypothetical protein SCP_0705340 [Sparassis crispa]|uniref:Mug135-like C-terminal domain-containing protein n=1 Tax=Sparassis crispa TaxID=139825 RepID=A0A401GT10_9APHY|nr:hypothetical protein SCP_0705340 [Sparassis crispa]GBE85347.1 hypothetical protein SCP_0705340 [Sparassis crispa]
MSDSPSLSDREDLQDTPMVIQLRIEAGEELPPQPNIPPSDYDICQAKLYERQVEINYMRGRANNAQFASAIKYKASVMTASDNNAAPVWFNQTMRELRRDIRKGFQRLERRLDDTNRLLDDTNRRLDDTNRLLADGNRRLADTQRTSGNIYNSMNAKGGVAPFIQIPWADGTYPWGFVHRNQPLPALTSVAVVEGLDGYQSCKIYQGYYPNNDVPEAQEERVTAILLAIGCVDRL